MLSVGAIVGIALGTVAAGAAIAVATVALYKLSVAKNTAALKQQFLAKEMGAASSMEPYSKM